MSDTSENTTSSRPTERILLDEDSSAKATIQKLASTGREVVTVQDLGMRGQDDEQVLNKAIELDMVLITGNGRDFHPLALQAGEHPGICHYHEGFRYRKPHLVAADVANALDNIDATGLDLRGQMIQLEMYSYKVTTTEAES